MGLNKVAGLKARAGWRRADKPSPMRPTTESPMTLASSRGPACAGCARNALPAYPRCSRCSGQSLPAVGECQRARGGSRRNIFYLEPAAGGGEAIVHACGHARSRVRRAGIGDGSGDDGGRGFTAGGARGLSTRSREKSDGDDAFSFAW